MSRIRPAPTALLRTGGSGGSGTGGAPAAQLLQQNASATGQHHTAFAHFRVSVHVWSQNVPRLDVPFLPRRLWPAGRGGAGRVALVPPALAAAQVETWLEGHAAAAGSGVSG